MSKPPTTLEEAYKALDEMLNSEDLEYIDSSPEAKAMGRFHNNLGRHLRNEWGLWNGSLLKEKLRQEFGVNHPDDLSHHLLIGYWHYRHQGKTMWERLQEG